MFITGAGRFSRSFCPNLYGDSYIVISKPYRGDDADNSRFPRKNRIATVLVDKLSHLLELGLPDLLRDEQHAYPIGAVTPRFQYAPCCLTALISAASCAKAIRTLG